MSSFSIFVSRRSTNRVGALFRRKQSKTAYFEGNSHNKSTETVDDEVSVCCQDPDATKADLGEPDKEAEKALDQEEQSKAPSKKDEAEHLASLIALQDSAREINNSSYHSIPESEHDSGIGVSDISGQSDREYCAESPVDRMALDGCSEDVVIKAMTRLNDEILRASANAVDTFDFHDIPATLATHHVKGGRVWLKNHFGKTMLDALIHSNALQRPKIARLCLQCVLCAYTRKIIKSWAFRPRDQEALLEEVYHGILQSEGQSVAARWRATAKRQAVRNFTRQDLESLDAMISDCMMNVLLSAGVRQHRGDVAAQLREPAESLVTQALLLHRLVGLEVLSSNLTPLYPLPEDTVTIPRPAGQANLKLPKEEVFCTTKLGLLRETKLADGSWDRATLLDPASILRSELRSFFDVSCSE